MRTSLPTADITVMPASKFLKIMAINEEQEEDGELGGSGGDLEGRVRRVLFIVMCGTRRRQCLT